MGETLRSGELAALSASGTSALLTTLGEVPTFEGTEATVQQAPLLTSPTAQAAQGGTNFVTLQLRRNRAGTATVIASWNLGTTALAAETPLAGTLASPVPTLASGDIVDLYASQTGTGGAVPAGSAVQVELN